MSLMDDITEISILQKKVAEETKYKCVCALMLNEKIDFSMAVGKLGFSPEEAEPLRQLMVSSNQQMVNDFYAKKFKHLIGRMEAKCNRQAYLLESIQKQITNLKMDDEIRRLEAETADIVDRSLLILSPKEKEALDTFRKQHCQRCETNTFRYEISGCGLGAYASVTCPVCGATVDITDTSSW